MKILLFAISAFLFLITIAINFSIDCKLQKLQSKLEKIEAFRENKIFKPNTSTVYSQICDIEQRAEILGFCYQCPLYLEKAQQDMQ